MKNFVEGRTLARILKKEFKPYGWEFRINIKNKDKIRRDVE